MSFWGEKDTSISFCEKQYEHSQYIAEYYNSLSGLVYSIIGFYFLNTKLKKMGYTLVLLGLGTFTLHATQRWYGQWLDELSMLLLSFQAIKYLRNIKKKKTYNFFFLWVIVLYYLLHNKTFIYMFTGCQFYIFHLLRKLKPKKNFEVISYIYRVLYKYIFIISIIAWLLDQLLCEYVKFLYLHSFWHIGTGFVAFLGLQNLLICE